MENANAQRQWVSTESASQARIVPATREPHRPRRWSFRPAFEPALQRLRAPDAGADGAQAGSSAAMVQWITLAGSAFRRMLHRPTTDAKRLFACPFRP